MHFSRLRTFKESGRLTKKEAEKMSIPRALTVDDFLVSLSNIQSENFASLQETLNIQTMKLEAIENLLKEMKTDEPEAEPGNLENPFAVKLEKPLVTSTPVKVVPEVVEEEEEKEVATNFKGKMMRRAQPVNSNGDTFFLLQTFTALTAFVLLSAAREPSLATCGTLLASLINVNAGNYSRRNQH